MLHAYLKCAKSGSISYFAKFPSFRMHKLSLAIFVLFVAGFNTEYTSFQYTLCHNATQTPVFTVYELNTSPTVSLFKPIRAIFK